jgi:hypothetical protein
MKKSKPNRMFWMFVVTIGTAVLAILSGFLQYREKIDTTQKSLKKEQELNAVYKQLQEKSNQIIDSTNEILNLNKELRVANERIIEIQNEQNQDLKNRNELEKQTNFNHLKRTTSDLFRLLPFKRAQFKELTQQEQIEFIRTVQSSLSIELTNQYLVSHEAMFKKWLHMYQVTSNYSKIFPAGEVTQETANGKHKLNKEELLQYNNTDFIAFVDQYYEFIRYITEQTKGIWF